MNHMVSTYNVTLFTTAAPFSLLRQSWRHLLKGLPRLSSGWWKYGSGCAKNTVSGRCCSATILQVP